MSKRAVVIAPPGSGKTQVLANTMLGSGFGYWKVFIFNPSRSAAQNTKGATFVSRGTETLRDDIGQLFLRSAGHAANRFTSLFLQDGSTFIFTEYDTADAFGVCVMHLLSRAGICHGEPRNATAARLV